MLDRRHSSSSDYKRQETISRACYKKSPSWQKEWDNGETGRSVRNILPEVKTTPTPWQKPELMFATGHFRHILDDSTSETAIPVVAETHYTMLQAGCLQPHTT
ncbi:hypothetical protein AVEN_152271-1 [Araneus ventricosus]|uniref:Uncharacterized protein n=1 Tax=Araneus ventricosus TaxID=182803 RepID=A0A4Y2LY28_ARAVE|nr:hypothetical protein AVEN_152271-1 [Araneus ventricosus]